MIRSLLRLFNLRSNEWQRVSLLFLIALLIFMAGVWGATVAYAAFLKQAGVGALPWILVSSAFLSVLASAVYTAFIDHFSNDTMMTLLLAIYAVLIGVGLAMIVAGLATVAFPLLYLMDYAWSVVFATHFANYLNNLYDIQAAKRIQPLGAAGFRMGAIIAGLTMSLVSAWLARETIIGVWCAVSALVAVLAWQMPHILKDKRQRTPAKKHESYWSNMLAGLAQIRQSAFLTWMAIGTTLLMMLISLLEFRTSAILLQSFGTAKQFADYIALLIGIGNLFVLPVLLFATSRLIGRLGLGNAVLIFPVGNILAASGLVLVPGLASASVAYFDRNAFRISFYAPVNNLLYNAVPMSVRGRARAFVSGLAAPIGSLVGGLILLIPLVQSQEWILSGLIILGAAGVLVCAIVLRRLYTQALVKMLEQEDYSFLLTREASELTAVDPATIAQLQKKLEASTNHELTVFIAQMIIQVGAKQAVPILDAAIRNAAEPRTRAALIDVVTAADLHDVSVRHLYDEFINDPDPGVRQSVIAGLEEIAATSGEHFLSQMLTLVQDPDMNVRVRALSALAHSDGFYKTPAAVQALEHFLADSDSHVRAAGVQVLGKVSAHSGADVEQIVMRLADYLNDPADQVRLESAVSLEEMASARPASKFLLGESQDAQLLAKIQPVIADPIERVRSAVLVVLSRLGSREAHKALLAGLGDPSSEVRSIAVSAIARMGKAAIPLVHPLLNAGDAELRKMGAVVLARINPREFGSLITETHITGNLLSIYRNHGLVQALEPCVKYSAVGILQSALREQNRQQEDEIFYLLSAIHDPSAVSVVYDSLRSSDARIRSNAHEALESMTSPQTANLVVPLFDPDIKTTDLLARSHETWEMEHPSTPDTFRQLATVPTDPWLRTITTFALGQIGAALPPPEAQQPSSAPTTPDTPRDAKSRDSQPLRRSRTFKVGDLLGGLGGNDKEADKTGQTTPKPEPMAPAPVVSESGLSRQEILTLLDKNCTDPIVDIQKASLAAQRVMAAGAAPAGQALTQLAKEDQAMLSTIEKIIFLKQVPFFQGMTVEQLRVLASVCEEEFFSADTRLYKEDDPGGILYVVVSGRVGIEQEKRKGSFARLATIDAYSYFGEMNLFDNSPRSNSAVAIQDTLTLRLRREPLIALARQHPDLSLELINVLSQRLRETSDRVADLTRTRPRELHKLYDAFDA